VMARDSTPEHVAEMPKLVTSFEYKESYEFPHDLINEDMPLAGTGSPPSHFSFHFL